MFVTMKNRVNSKKNEDGKDRSQAAMVDWRFTQPKLGVHHETTV
jgi:hypothetical protein